MGLQIYKEIYNEEEYMIISKKEITEHLHKYREIKRKNNGWIGGTVPFGYTHYRGELRVNEHDKQILEEIYKLERTMTKQEIFEYMDAHEYKRHNGRPISRSTVYRAFEAKRIEIYLGIKYTFPICKQDENLYELIERYKKENIKRKV